MTDAITNAFDDHTNVIIALREHIPLIRTITDALIATLKNGGRIYTLGNGGSAADAQHIAAELLGRFKRDRKALPAVALTTDTSVLTAVGNDLGADDIFRRQIEGLVTEKDLVWALSVSGSSPNVIAALKLAKQLNATVVGFTSTKGTAMADLCTHCLMVPATTSDRVQEAHELCYHIICDLVEQTFANPPS